MYIYKTPVSDQPNHSFQTLNRQKYSVQNREVQIGCNRCSTHFLAIFHGLKMNNREK